LETCLLNDEAFFEGEMENCTKAVTIYPRNYYAWTYRQHVITQLMNFDFLSNKAQVEEIRCHCVKSKLDELFNWLKRNVSDHSCVNHLIILMKAYKKALVDQGNEKELAYYLIYLLKQFYYNQYLIIFFPGHQSLWTLRRFLWLFLFENCHLYEKYFTEETLNETITHLIDIAQEQFSHSSIDSK